MFQIGVRSGQDQIECKTSSIIYSCHTCFQKGLYADTNSIILDSFLINSLYLYMNSLFTSLLIILCYITIIIKSCEKFYSSSILQLLFLTQKQDRSASYHYQSKLKSRALPFPFKKRKRKEKESRALVH